MLIVSIIFRIPKPKEVAPRPPPKINVNDITYPSRQLLGVLRDHKTSYAQSKGTTAGTRKDATGAGRGFFGSFLPGRVGLGIGMNRMAWPSLNRNRPSSMIRNYINTMFPKIKDETQS